MKKQNQQILIGVGLLVILLGAYGGYTLFTAWSNLKGKNADLTAALAAAETENASLTDALNTEKARNDSFESQINNISGTVGKLDKLSKTDPQLLAKYSKVYFLNENYVPAHLSQIPKDEVNGTADRYFLAEALPFLEDLLNAAKGQEIDLSVLSSYRSFESQTDLKQSYKITYGTGANSFSADQGYSEHQLGTAADFTTKEIGGGLAGFDKTKAYAWLSANAYIYGFILSYPANNKYYIFEPWHWRFVGRDLAGYLHNQKLNFYDIDQRDINTYLISLFD